MSELVLVLDFGGQYKELIARTVRGLSVYSEIRQGNIPADEVKRLSPVGIILTGGPNSVYLPDSPECDPEIFNLGIPILGICYGMQMMCRMLGGEVLPCECGEYGIVNADLDASSVLFQDLRARNAVLMSHNDGVSRLPDGFVNTGKTAGCANAACENAGKKLYGVQFHPEAEHTAGGRGIIRSGSYDKIYLYNRRSRIRPWQRHNSRVIRQIA